MFRQRAAHAFSEKPLSISHLFCLLTDGHKVLVRCLRMLLWSGGRERRYRQSAMHKHRGPKWWMLRLLALLMGGLLVLAYQAPLSPGSHQIAQAAIVLLVYGVTVWWLRQHRGAFIHEEQERLPEAVELSQRSDTGGRAACPGAGSPGRSKGQ
jgi:Flp pilus assembly protein TadB